MTELELLRLMLAGTPIHLHKSPKRGRWHCTSPYCTNLAAELPTAAPGSDDVAVYDKGNEDA